MDGNSARGPLGVDDADVRSIRKKRRQELGLRVVSGTIVSAASFVAAYIVARDAWWPEQEVDSYPYCAVALAVQPRLRGSAIALLIVAAVSATIGAAAGIVLGEPEPLSAVRYGTWAKDD